MLPPVRRGALAALLAFALALAAPAAAQEDRRPRPEAAQPPAAAAEEEGAAEEDGPRVPYEVTIQGVTGELRDLLESVSEARALADRPPATVTVLRRRARADVPRLLQALRSQGYYDAEVEVDVDAGREPARVTFRVRPGGLYRLREITIEAPPGTPFEPPRPAEIGLEPGQPAAGRPILDAEAELLRRAQRQGFALAEIGARTAAIERGAAALDLTLRIEPGPRVRLGEIEVTGLERTEEPHVRRRLQLEPGMMYDPERLAAARERLVETGLFASVRFRLGEEPGPEGRLPLTVEVVERPHRSIGVGVNYWTDVGIGGNVSWENRNAFGRGELARVEAEAVGLGSAVSSAFELTGSFRKPDVRRLDQTFFVTTTLSETNTDAFDSTSLGAQIGVERPFGRRTTGSLALAFRVGQAEDAGGSDDTFGLLSLPASLSRDTSDDPLDPTAGARLRLDLAPFVDTFGSGTAFGKAAVRYARYYQASEEPRIILAGRVAVGTLFGAERDDVPPDERYFAGGGGSIRGYGFQTAAPLNEEDEPVGGRSFLELVGEVRGRITESIGAVAFVDAGRAYEAVFPDFEEEFLVGTGVGLRYFTPIGPLRLDVAFPLVRRDEIDDAFQLYISFGQAF